MTKTNENKMIEVAKTAKAIVGMTESAEQKAIVGMTESAEKTKKAVKKTPSGFKAVTDADKAKARKEAKPKASDKALPVKTQIVDDVPTEVGYDASLKTAAFQAVYGEYKDVLDAAEELLNSIGNAETKQAKFITAVLKNAAKLQRVKPNSAAPLLQAAYRTIKSQLFRGYARKTFAVLSERAGISFDSEGTPSQLFDPDKADKLAEWLSIGGRKIGMIKTESDKPKQSEFDPWKAANKFLSNLKDYSNKTEDATERAERLALFETLSGSIDRACRKYEGKSLKAFLSE